MEAALAALAEKAALALMDEALKVKPHVHGEWLGVLDCEKVGKLWQVRQPAEDPLRLWVPDLGFEYAFKGGFESDGGSIPHFLQSIRQLRLKPDSFLKTYFLHDYCYELQGVWCRKTKKMKWVWVPVTRPMADCLLYIGLTAEDATLAEARAIYRAVRIGGGAAWARCRRAEEKEAKR